MILEKKTSPAAEAAIAKLQDGMKDVTGQKEKAVVKPVVEALADFCRQSDEFSEAVTETGKCLRECLGEIMRGVGSSISDIEVYRRAVAFWMPGYTVQMQMLLIREGEKVENPGRSAEPAPAAKPKRIVMTLEDLL